MSDSLFTMDQIKALSEKDLRATLRSNSINAGPLGRNRGIYEKRLFKVMHGHDFGKPPGVGTPRARPPSAAKDVTAASAVPMPRAKTPRTGRRNAAAGGGDSTNMGSRSPGREPNGAVSLGARSPARVAGAKSPARVPGGIRQEESPKVTRSVDFNTLTNQEIRALLRRNGQTCGPIPNESIRNLMIKKLKRLEHERGGLNRSTDPSPVKQPAQSKSPARATTPPRQTTPSRPSAKMPMAKLNGHAGRVIEPDMRPTKKVVPRTNDIIPLKPSKAVMDLTVPTLNGQFSSEDDGNEPSPPSTRATRGGGIGVDSGAKNDVANVAPVTHIIAGTDGFSATEDEAENSATPVSNFTASPGRTASSSKGPSASSTTPWGRELENVHSSFYDDESEMRLKTFQDTPPIVNGDDASMSYARKRRSFARLSAGHNLADTTQQHRELEAAAAEAARASSDAGCVPVPTCHEIYRNPTLLQKVQEQEVEEQSKPTAGFSRFVTLMPRLFLLGVLVLSALLACSYFYGDGGVPQSGLGCNSNDPALCMTQGELDENTNYALNKMHRQLNDVAALHQCGETLQDPQMKLIDLIQTFNTNYDTSSEVVRGVLLQFLRHPKYGVTMFDMENKVISAESSIRADHVHSLLIPEPAQEHEKCRFRKLKAQILETIWTPQIQFYLTLALVTLVSLKLAAAYIRRRSQRKTMIAGFIDQILDHVETEKEIVATHLRDELITMDNRQSLLPLWNEAIKRVQEQDTRVVFKVSEVNGEYCEVLQWGAHKEVPVFSSRWKGQAFTPKKQLLEKSPQGCRALKIRDFYRGDDEINSGEKKYVLIQELIGQVNITLGNAKKAPIEPAHYAFQEKCVYVRFGCEEDAVDFYNASNAQWFDNRLLTPKFIMDKKYFQRFPLARAP